MKNNQSLARASDPETSRLAADELTRSGARSSQKGKVLWCLSHMHGPRTSAEVALIWLLDRYMVARRLPDLERDGLVVKHDARECAVSGRQAVTWGLPRPEQGQGQGRLW